MSDISDKINELAVETVREQQLSIACGTMLQAVAFHPKLSQSALEGCEALAEQRDKTTACIRAIAKQLMEEPSQ